jgi:hypothetical protein
MDPPYGAILFLAILSIFAAILSIRQARRKGDKIHYIGAVVGCLMLSVFALALLNQALFAFILLVVGGIACIAALPRVMVVQKREMDEQLAKAIEETDLSEPLRLRDFLRWKGWLKLAHRWGVWKTVSIYSILGVAVIAGVSYTVLSVFNIMNIWLVVGYTISATIIIFILFYRQISKALKRSEISEASKG